MQIFDIGDRRSAEATIPPFVTTRLGLLITLYKDQIWQWLFKRYTDIQTLPQL